MDINEVTASISGIKRKKLRNFKLNEESKNFFGFLIIGRIKSAVGYSYGKEVIFLQSFYSDTEFQNIKKFPGDKEKYKKLMKKLEKNYCERISRSINFLFRKIEKKYGEELGGIFIGGPNSLKIEFIRNNFLDELFKEVVIDFIDINNQGYEGFKNLIEMIKFRIFKDGLYSFRKEKYKTSLSVI
jgi:peptide subunit release factor 1 (eRF1)